MTAKTGKIKIKLNSFDFIKGLCMIAVVLGHMSFRYRVEELAGPIRYLYQLLVFANGAMPVFFLISGYGFKEKPVKELLKQTVRQLIKPYLLVMAIFVVLYPITFYFWYGEWSYGFYEAGLYLAAFLLGIPKPGKVLFGYTIYHCSAVWFFLASFVAANIMNLLMKIKNTTLRVLSVIICVVVGYELVIRDINFYCIAQGLMAVGFYYIGTLLKKYQLLERGVKSIWSYVVLIPVAAVFILKGEFNMCLGTFHNGLLDYIGVCGTAVLLLFLGVLVGQLEWKILDWISEIGMYTYWIICIHVVENDCMQWFAYSLAIPNQNLAYVSELIIKIVLITAGCFVLKKYTQYQYRRRRRLVGK